MVLDLGKRYAPRRFPAVPTSRDDLRQLNADWGSELERLGNPPEMWREAVLWWCRTATGHDAWDLAEARRAGEHVRSQWLGTPRGKEFLERYWERRRQANLARLGAPSELPESGSASMTREEAIAKVREMTAQFANKWDLNKALDQEEAS